ncbi:hypothetical protein I3760_04G126500 [Carya illinoinensis]|nr:hypothetical protein I3760_04G126500 [Carya illinoinensis]
MTKKSVQLNNLDMHMLPPPPPPPHPIPPTSTPKPLPCPDPPPKLVLPQHRHQNYNVNHIYQIRNGREAEGRRKREGKYPTRLGIWWLARTRLRKRSLSVETVVGERALPEKSFRRTAEGDRVEEFSLPEKKAE